MLEKIVAGAKKVVIAWARSIGETVKRLVMPSHAMAAAAHDAVRPRTELVAENALLRQQLIVARRKIKRPPLRDGDRFLMVLLARFNGAWRDALHLAKPDTLLRWHRDLFKLLWRRKSRSRGNQPRRLDGEVIELIRTMARDNVLWGAERIRGELLKLGIRVSKRTIQKYMKQARPPRRHSQTWKAFLKNHGNDIWACDFLQLHDALFRPIFAFFIVKHGTREVVHVGVTRSPSDQWTAQQLREATPFGEGPRFLIRDNDGEISRQRPARVPRSRRHPQRDPPSPGAQGVRPRVLQQGATPPGAGPANP